MYYLNDVSIQFYSNQLKRCLIKSTSLLLPIICSILWSNPVITISKADYKFLPIVFPPAFSINRQMGTTSYKTLNLAGYLLEATLANIPWPELLNLNLWWTSDEHQEQTLQYIWVSILLQSISRSHQHNLYFHWQISNFPERIF